MSVQEDINQRSIALVMRTSRVTGQTLAKGIRMYLQHRKNKKLYPKMAQGKQSVKDLAKQGQGMSSLDMNDNDIKLFDKLMKKYGVDYAVMVDKKSKPPIHTIFFKGKDADAVTKAFTEFTTEITQKQSRTSVLAQLRKFVEIVKNNSIDKVKNKEKEHTR